MVLLSGLPSMRPKIKTPNRWMICLVFDDSILKKKGTCDFVQHK